MSILKNILQGQKYAKTRSFQSYGFRAVGSDASIEQKIYSQAEAESEKTTTCGQQTVRPFQASSSQ